MGFEIVCCVAMGDSNAYHHLIPIAMHPLVSKLWIVRHKKVLLGDIPKSEYRIVANFKPCRWLQMYWHCKKLAKRKNVKAFISFSPLPYGLIAGFAAHRYGKALHCGFIGSDWYRDAKGKWGKWFLPTIRKASFFTVTGSNMSQELIEYGFESQRINTLPHSIDLNHYPVADLNQARYACIFVGGLIRRKRVDLILRSFAQVLKLFPNEKLCIVGSGPLDNDLKKLTKELGISSSVDFIGQVSDAQPYLSLAKINIIASFREGFPFSLVEGICCGVVPVSTPVGTISDYIHNEENGLLFPVGDDEALANCLCRLLEKPVLYDRLRANVIDMRQRFSHENATQVWDKWFRMLEPQEQET